LIVVNTNAGSGKGLVFWNGNRWERIITHESAKAYMLYLGKKVSFVGGTKTSFPHSNKDYVRLGLNQIVLNEGEVSNNEYVIRKDGVYEISVKWSGVENGSKALNGHTAVKIMLNSGGAVRTLAEGKGNKSVDYTGMSASALYSGYFKNGDKISFEMRCVDNTPNGNPIPTKVNLTNIGIKRLTSN
jgi:hypothetical protein